MNFNNWATWYIKIKKLAHKMGNLKYNYHCHNTAITLITLYFILTIVVINIGGLIY